MNTSSPRTNTLAWRTKSVGSDNKYWPPLETGFHILNNLTMLLQYSLSDKIPSEIPTSRGKGMVQKKI